MKTQLEAFDVIVVDSSDPVGPAESLFGRDFYAAAKAALRLGGVICAQGECMYVHWRHCSAARRPHCLTLATNTRRWLHAPLIESVLTMCHEIGFKHAQYAWLSIPSYPSGTIGIIVATNGDVAAATPQRTFDAAVTDSLRCVDCVRSALGASGAQKGLTVRMHV